MMKEWTSQETQQLLGSQALGADALGGEGDPGAGGGNL